MNTEKKTIDACCNTKTTEEKNDPFSSSSCKPLSFTIQKTKIESCNDACCAPTPQTHDNEEPPKMEPDVATTVNPQIYEIEGMDCGSCAITLSKHVSSELGIPNVDVNFSTAKMKINYDGDVDRVLKAVEQAGYKATPVQTGRRRVQSKATNWSQDIGVRNTIVSGVFLLIGYILSFIMTETTPTLFYATATIIAGYRPAKNAWYAIKSRSLDMNVLMVMAAVGAAIIGEWLEGATVVFLFGLGNALQTISIDKTRKSIQSLMDLAPNEATVYRNGAWAKVPVEEVSVNEVIVVQPGERIPLDGIVVKGASGVNQAPITGESLPVEKQPNDGVFAGTICENGALEIKVTKLVEDTAISRIIHLVEEAQEKKAPTEQFVDKFARIYTPIVFGLAFALMVLPPLFVGNWSEWFYRGLELLVVACPCALVISTPVAVVSAIGNAAKNGILIKGGSALEIAGRLTHIAFDKTGTLTEGKPSVAKVLPITVTDKELLSIAKSIEERSKHPIAQAVVAYANEMNLSSQPSEDHQAIVGKGAQATINGITYYAGNERLFADLKIDLSSVKGTLEKWQSEGKTIVIIGDDTSILGMIAVADTIRKTSHTALEMLRNKGITTVMLTGDNNGSASFVGKQLTINQVKADLLPDQKLNEINHLKEQGTIAMIGDGINDAPALAASHIGIAMGGAGTDTAMETADIVLMADNLEKLPHVIDLSKRALTIIKQNIWFSILIKALALLLIFPGWLTLWIAVLSDTGAAMLVILNSMRLLRK